MSYGFEVRNSSGAIVVDSNYACLSVTTTSTSNYNGTSYSWLDDLTGQFVTVYEHDVSAANDEFLFVNMSGNDFVSGAYKPSTGVKRFLSNKTSVTYFKARKPITAGSYGLATYSATGELLYSADENLVSIKDVAKFTSTVTSTSRSSGVNYVCVTPSSFYIFFSQNVYGIITWFTYFNASVSQLSLYALRNPVIALQGFVGSTPRPDMYILTAKYG